MAFKKTQKNTIKRHTLTSVQHKKNKNIKNETKLLKINKNINNNNLIGSNNKKQNFLIYFLTTLKNSLATCSCKVEIRTKTEFSI